MKQVTGGVCAAQGFSAAGIHCGIRRNQSKRDLALIYSAVPASAAAVYTSNLVKGAPLTVTKAHLADGKAQAVICNSGNANTCNADGVAVAEEMSALTAAQRGLHVVLLEPNKMLGKKLRITGKGRCNVTNHCDVKTILANIPGDGRFLYSALNRLGPQDTICLLYTSPSPRD